MEKKVNEKVFNPKNIYLVMASIVIFLFLVIFIESKSEYIMRNLSGLNLFMVRFNIMFFSLVSVVALVVQYLFLKKDSVYITMLFYFSVFAETVFKFLISSGNTNKLYSYSFYNTVILRGIFLIILLISLFKNGKVINNKKSFFTVYLLLTLLVVFLDLFYLGKSSIIFNVSHQVALIVDILSIIIVYFVMLKNIDILYFCISINIMLSIICNIYDFYFLTKGVNTFLKSNSSLQLGIFLLSFTILLTSILLKSYEVLREKEEKEKDVVNQINFIEDNISELILILNGNFIIEYASSSFKNFLGYKKEEIIGKEFWDITCKGEKENYYNIISKSYNSKNINEINLLSKNGEVKNSSAKITNFSNNKGKNAGVAMFLTLNNKNELEKLKGELNERREYEEHQKEFYADLSHELRTPVNIMYSSIQLLELKKNSGSLEEFMAYYNKYGKIMMQNSLVMLKLINNLIDTTKVDSGFTKGEFNNYNIVSIIENITMLSIPYLEAKNISLIFDTELEECYIKCDPDKIERIMLNLLSNAAKYTEENGRIDVNLLFDDNYATIVVKDSGIGIPEEMQNNIFKKFEQVQDRREKKLGSGIGLALVKSLVEMHNGIIELKSKLGEGSEFIIKLPNEIDLSKDDNFSSYNYEIQCKGNLSIEFSDLQ